MVCSTRWASQCSAIQCRLHAMLRETACGKGKRSSRCVCCTLHCTPCRLHLSFCIAHCVGCIFLFYIAHGVGCTLHRAPVGTPSGPTVGRQYRPCQSRPTHSCRRNEQSVATPAMLQHVATNLPRRVPAAECRQSPDPNARHSGTLHSFVSARTLSRCRRGGAGGTRLRTRTLWAHARMLPIAQRGTYRRGRFLTSFAFSAYRSVCSVSSSCAAPSRLRQSPRWVGCVGGPRMHARLM